MSLLVAASHKKNRTKNFIIREACFNIFEPKPMICRLEIQRIKARNPHISPEDAERKALIAMLSLSDQTGTCEIFFFLFKTANYYSVLLIIFNLIHIILLRVSVCKLG